MPRCWRSICSICRLTRSTGIPCPICGEPSGSVTTPSVVPEPPDSWSVLWDARYKGKISMLNDQREVFGAVLRSMGHSLNTRDIRP
ncbi:MAG: hypothetical protein KatS3mg082_0281 [Nitrospiraceae bacterium]|nr:MAG: hypothetical protein KatS3mg082_0281 [Nitrospiraceae bacterium]